jgi:hypothetical protein
MSEVNVVENEASSSQLVTSALDVNARGKPQACSCAGLDAHTLLAPCKAIFVGHELDHSTFNVQRSTPTTIMTSKRILRQLDWAIGGCCSFRIPDLRDDSAEAPIRQLMEKVTQQH